MPFARPRARETDPSGRTMTWHATPLADESLDRPGSFVFLGSCVFASSSCLPAIGLSPNGSCRQTPWLTRPRGRGFLGPRGARKAFRSGSLESGSCRGSYREIGFARTKPCTPPRSPAAYSWLLLAEVPRPSQGSGIGTPIVKLLPSFISLLPLAPKSQWQ